MPDRKGPAPALDDWEWQHQGLCRDKSSELFFHPEGERGSARRAREDYAVTLCQQCPVKEPCLAHALAVPEPYGVWGGVTEDEREAIAASEAATPPDDSVA